MADAVERVRCGLGVGEHYFPRSVRIGVNPHRDTCVCGAVRWADVAQARAEPPPFQHDIALARANQA